MNSDLVTKADLRSELAQLCSELRTDLTVEIAQMKSELRVEIAGVKSDLLPWIIALFLSQIAFGIGVLLKLS